MLPFVVIFITIGWHLDWNSCIYFLTGQYNQRISFPWPPGVCQFPPGSGEQNKCLQENREVQMTYSLGAQSFVSPENGILCVSPRPMRGPEKRSWCLQGEWRKCKSFPARLVVWRLLPRSQDWIIVAGIHYHQWDFCRKARFQEILLRAGVCKWEVEMMESRKTFAFPSKEELTRHISDQQGPEESFTIL